MLELVCAIKEADFRLPEVGSHDVPDWMRGVLTRGLHVDPAQRWPSMDALLEALTTEPEPEPTLPVPQALRRFAWLAIGLALGVAGLAWAVIHAVA